MATPDLAPEEIYDLAKIALAQAHDINHIMSRGVACRPLASPAKWKLEWKTRSDTVVTAIDRYVEEHPDTLRVPRALGEAPFEVCGHRGERKIVTFTQWKGQRVRAAYEEAAGRADSWFARFGEPARLIPEIRHPLTRKDFKEVLG